MSKRPESYVPAPEELERMEKMLADLKLTGWQNAILKRTIANSGIGSYSYTIPVKVERLIGPALIAAGVVFLPSPIPWTVFVLVVSSNFFGGIARRYLGTVIRATDEGIEIQRPFQTVTKFPWRETETSFELIHPRRSQFRTVVSTSGRTVAAFRYSQLGIDARLVVHRLVERSQWVHGPNETAALFKHKFHRQLLPLLVIAFTSVSIAGLIGFDLINYEGLKQGDTKGWMMLLLGSISIASLCILGWNYVSPKTAARAVERLKAKKDFIGGLRPSSFADYPRTER